MTIADFNPFDLELIKNPYPTYEELRSRNGVYYNQSRDFWVVSRYEDVKSILKNTRDFSSAQGVHLMFDTNGKVVKSAQQNGVPLLIQLDPPSHTQARSLIQKAFTQTRVIELEPAIRKIVKSKIDSFIDKGECDFVDEFASPFPVDVISMMVGFDEKYRNKLRTVSKELVQTSSDPKAYRPHVMELFPILIEEINIRKKEPKDDLLSDLIHAEVDGERLTDPQLYTFFFLLLIAGSETTTNLLSNSILLMHQHQEIRKDLIENTHKIPEAVEEFLRLESPAQGLVRTTTKNVVVQGVEIPKGEKILLLFGAANRDPDKFLNNDSINIENSSKDHLAFGYGVHFCLGANLARLEAKIALEEFLSRVPDYVVVGPEINWLESGIVRGLKNLNLRFTPSYSN